MESRLNDTAVFDMANLEKMNFSPSIYTKQTTTVAAYVYFELV